MAKKMYVIQAEDGMFFCGMKYWDKQIRKAKIYHSLTYAKDIVNEYEESNCKIVEVSLTIVPEAKTNADRIRSMSDEELAAFLFSMVDCVSCQNKLMNNGKLVFGADRKTCTDKDYYAMCDGDGRKCESVCLEWLKQPAKETK